MYWRHQFLPICFLFGMCLIQTSDAIICFICSSTDTSNNPACGDVFKISISDHTYRSDCMGSCVKRRGARYNGSVRRVEIIRSCILRKAEGCYKEDYSGIEMETCVCNADFCNTSTRVLHSVYLVSGFCLASVVFYINSLRNI